MLRMSFSKIKTMVNANWNSREWKRRKNRISNYEKIVLYSIVILFIWYYLQLKPVSLQAKRHTIKYHILHPNIHPNNKTSFLFCDAQNAQKDKVFRSCSLVWVRQILQELTEFRWWEFELFPISITITPSCRVGPYSFPWIAPLYPWYVPYIAEC